jgi:hypothetical protein
LAIITKFFGGVEEFEKVGGGCVVHAFKYIIFFQTHYFLPIIITFKHTIFLFQIKKREGGIKIK